MKFQHPYLLLFVVPLIVCWFVLVRRKASVTELRRSPFLLLAVISLIFALANPYWSTVQEARTERGANLILMIDVSQSMFCLDGTPTRIDQARSFVRSILQQFEGSPVAVVYFAGDAQLGCPLTTDFPAIYLFLDSIVPGMAARSGTMAAPLESAMKDLLADISSRQTSRKQIGLLFSDGEFFDSDSGFRRWLSGQNDLTLFTFPCGKGATPVPKYDLSGSYPGAVSKPNPEALKALAESTGGLSYPVATTNAAIVSKEMARRVTEVIAEGKVVPRYRYYPFLLTALLLLLIYQLYPVFSRSIQMSKLAPAVSILVFMFVALAAANQENYGEKFSQAVQEIKHGRLEEGFKKLKELEAKAKNEELEIALGNVFLQKKQPEAAIPYYRNALRMNPFNERARWNWEVAIKMQSGSQSPPPPPPPTITPNQIPEESRALLDYFDQLEKEDRKQENKKNANESTFAW